MPLTNDIKTYPTDVKKVFLETPIRCPYTNGKMMVSRMTIKTVAAVKELFKTLFTGKKTDPYGAILEQINKEKEGEYVIWHEITKLRITSACEIVKELRTSMTGAEVKQIIDL
jgi:hypothetical protein